MWDIDNSGILLNVIIYLTKCACWVGYWHSIYIAISKNIVQAHAHKAMAVAPPLTVGWKSSKEIGSRKLLLQMECLTNKHAFQIGTRQEVEENIKRWRRRHYALPASWVNRSYCRSVGTLSIIEVRKMPRWKDKSFFTIK
jgi:hypothetical protein